MKNSNVQPIPPISGHLSNFQPFKLFRVIYSHFLQHIAIYIHLK